MASPSGAGWLDIIIIIIIIIMIIIIIIIINVCISKMKIVES